MAVRSYEDTTRLQYEAIARAGPQVFYRLLRAISHPSHLIPVPANRRAWQDLRRSSPVVLDRDTLGLPPHCGSVLLYVVSMTPISSSFFRPHAFRVAVLIAIGIYLMAGRHVWKKRDAIDVPGFLNPFNEDPFTNVIKTTEVTITHTERKASQPNCEVREIAQSHVDGTYDAYSVNIEIAQQPQRPQRPRAASRPAVFRLPSVTRAVALSEDKADSFLYARVAFLFFITLLITWVPSSVNRAYALAHPENVNFAMNYTSAIVFSSQGFLNCLVYMSTSRSACRRLWRMCSGRSPEEPGRLENVEAYAMGGGNRVRRKQRLRSDSSSLTNLTAPAP
ncbi:MAG: hypothetical protein Q9222_000808 [Ikaeria aurantiellina]